MEPIFGKPIPEGLQRERTRRTQSIDRLDKIIKLGGAVGEMFSIFDQDDNKAQRRPILVGDNLTFDDLDLETRADPATYSRYGKLINKECKEKGIPTPYPGGIDWTFRNTKDRVWTVNTLMYLLIQRRTAEKFILDMKEVIDILHENLSEDEAKIKELTETIAEKDEKIADLNPEREVKRKTDAFHAREELFKQKEESFQKQADAFKRKEQQMEVDFKKLSKDLASTRKAKTDVERKNRFILNEKRSLETQYKNIQKRLKSKLDQVSKKAMVALAMRQIGEFTLFETEEEKRQRKLKDPEKIAWDIYDEWNQNIQINLDEIKTENELLRDQVADLKQNHLVVGEVSDHSRSHHNEAVEQSLPLAKPEGEQDEENYSRLSVYDFYFARLTEIFTEHVPESLEEIPTVLQSFPEKEHLIYEKVCSKFGITPVPEYFGANSIAVRLSLTEKNLGKSGLNRASFRSEEVKRDENVPRNYSITSLPWLDDNTLDGMSVDLERGWSFANSDEVVVKPFLDIGMSSTKPVNEKDYTSC